MFNIGQKVKIAYPDRDLLEPGGDAREALLAGILSKDRIYKIYSIRENARHETMLVDVKTGKAVSWYISWDCLAPVVTRKRNLPAWW